MEYVPDLGRAMHIGLEGCAALITQMSAELRELEKLAGQDVNTFKKEREFTAMLMAMIDHSVLVQDPMVGCMALYQELAASSEKSNTVDYEALRKKFKEARLQAGLTKQPNWGGLGGGSTGMMAGGMQPLSLAPAFHAVAPAFPSVPQQQYAQPTHRGFGGVGHYGPSQHRFSGRGFGGNRRGGRFGKGAGRGGAAVCGKCSQMGKPADHSYRTCPAQACFKCGMRGHIKSDCPN